MKVILLLYLSFYFVSLNADVVGLYNIVSDTSIDTLEIKDDGTFIYKDLGDSCWLWNEFSGDWKITNNELILYRYPAKSENFKKTTQKRRKLVEYHFLISEGKLESISFPIKAKSTTYLKQ